MKKILIYLSTGLIILLISVILTYLYSRSWQNAFFIDPIYELTTDKKALALTFDDGPSQIRTLALLDVLNKYNIKATFFMLGKNIKKYPTTALAVFKQGHLIGNHSYDHPRLILKSPSFVRQQIKKTDLLIKLVGQEKIEYFRPPYSSKYIVLPLVLQSLGKKLVTGTYDPPSEYASPYNAKKVANEVIENARPRSIIYLHDGKNTDQ